MFVSSSYRVILGELIEERLHSGERLTDKINAVILTPSGAFMIKKTPIVFSFEHLICLF